MSLCLFANGSKRCTQARRSCFQKTLKRGMRCVDCARWSTQAPSQFKTYLYSRRFPLVSVRVTRWVGPSSQSLEDSPLLRRLFRRRAPSTVKATSWPWQMSSSFLKCIMLNVSGWTCPNSRASPQWWPTWAHFQISKNAIQVNNQTLNSESILFCPKTCTSRCMWVFIHAKGLKCGGWFTTKFHCKIPLPKSDINVWDISAITFAF